MAFRHPFFVGSFEPIFVCAGIGRTTNQNNIKSLIYQGFFVGHFYQNLHKFRQNNVPL
ncbi:hypothetical protein EVA_14284 [gut metagenome]|uniref:Uncharacterized protein n=1 Tax=gut metagenome TaxID=749906 RepID=J9CCF9_9ZZZZ